MISKEVFSRDRLAVGLAVCTLLLLLVFFYGLHQNVAGLGQEIEELKSLNSAVLMLESRHTMLDSKVTELNTLPRKTTVMTMENQVRSMAHAADDLEQRLGGRHRDKLSVIRTLLQEIGQDLHDSK
ncbi:MAG: hypothetical protein GXY42_01600 [Desulfovibrionales bacterium]|nr:hypothetical protein [Desulfovibrionales bacterium]